jgi:hypothetical protein
MLGAVPLADGFRPNERHGGWVRNSRSPVWGPPVSSELPGHELGQFNLTPTPAAGADATTQRCYLCGNQGYRLMTQSMASMVPGGCTEVASSFCTAAPTSTSAPTTGSGTPIPGTGSAQGHWSDGPTEITVLVYEPNELKPYTAGVPVIIFVYKNAATISLTEVARGTTNSSGMFVWKGSAPPSNKDYRFRVKVEAPGNVKSTDVPARDATSAASGGGYTSKSSVTVVACPSGTDSLVCAVAQAQLDWKAIYDSQIVAWGNSTQAQSFAADMAHANVPLNHPTLRADWETYSWWVGDRWIPPKDWPALTREFKRTMSLFNAIPFPRWTGIETLFSRCARTIPIGQGKNAELYSVMSPRLYSRTWSNYFPRSDKQIIKDMAAAYMIGLQSVFKCMEHRIRQKIKETQRTMKVMSILSYGIVLINLPLLVAAGVGGIAAFAMETYDFVNMTNASNSPLGYGVTAGIAAASLGAGDPAIVVAALEPIVNEILENVDPTVAMAIKQIYPQIVRTAMQAMTSIATNAASEGSNTLSSGAASFTSMGAITSAIMVMAVKAMAAIPKMYAADRIEKLGDALAGATSAAQDLVGFVAGEEVSPTFKPFLIWVVEAMGLLELVDAAIDDFLNQFQQALESGDAQGGGVTVVPEKDGGGPTFTPTDPNGTPTDVNGNPLPGGVAPITPPSGGGTAPGVKPPETPPMPTTSTNAPVDGISSVTAIGTGGVTAALLLVAGSVLS